MNLQTPKVDDLTALAPASAESDSSSRIRVSLLDLGHIAVTRFRAILGTTLLLLFMVAVATYSMTPLYTATAVVMIQQQQTNVVDLQMVLSGLPTDETSILNQVQVLQSRDLANEVISQLNLDRDPEFNANLKHSWKDYLAYANPLHWIPHGRATDVLDAASRRQLARDAVVDKFLSRLSVSQIELSTGMKIGFDSADPAKARRIANAIAATYVDDQLRAKYDATKKATLWLASQVEQLAKNARAAESAAVQYKSDNHITEIQSPLGGGTVSVLDQQVAAINADLIQARTDKAQAQAALSRVRSLVSQGRADSVTQVVNSPLIGQLRQQQVTLAQQQAQMASRYGPDHPKMLDLKAAQADLKLKINQEISHVVSTVENDVVVASSREASLLASLKALESQSSVQGQARVKLAELESNAASSRALYDTFVSRAKQTEEQQGLQLPDARVISLAAIPTKSSFPNFLLVFGLGFPAALLIGFLVAFLIERLDRGFRLASRAEQMLGLPVLATLPDTRFAKRKRSERDKSEGGEPSAADEVIHKPLSSYAESVRGLQMGLNLSNVDRVPKVILCTSAVPSEGKTTVSLSLARHAAQSGQKVVLLDCDLRRPNVAKTARVNAGSYDAVDVLRGVCTLEQAIVKDPICPLDILPTVKVVKNAPDLLGSKAMATLVERLRQSYDLVVIDSAPILPVNDTKVLTRLVDSVLFVIRWEVTPRDAAAEAVKALREIHAPIAGVALSRADTRRLQYYSFGYVGYGYGGYEKYYQS